MAGRFAPTPTADLHLGNLRTALVAWLAARATGRDFLIRIEDLDAARIQAAGDIAGRQLADLAALGLTHDGPVVRQSERTSLYAAALESLHGRTYECFCSRQDIALAAQAPHLADGIRAYPGTCRDLTETERAQLRGIRPPAIRLHADGAEQTIADALHGSYTGVVDDFVLRRSDGVFAYNFAVVVDDGLQGVDHVVRGDDLLGTTPRQAWLARALGFPVPAYVHVPLVYDAHGDRLAKRDGSAGLAGLGRRGITPDQALARLAVSLNLAAPGEAVTAQDLIARFDVGLLPREPWLVDVASWGPYDSANRMSMT